MLNPTQVRNVRGCRLRVFLSLRKFNFEGSSLVKGSLRDVSQIEAFRSGPRRNDNEFRIQTRISHLYLNIIYFVYGSRISHEVTLKLINTSFVVVSGLKLN